MAFVLLAACGSSEVVRHGGATRAPQRVVSQPRYGATVAVQRGDTLYRIAVNNRISPLDLAIWNGIAPPYTIYPGQRLRLYPSSGSMREPVVRSPSRRPSTSTAPRPTPPPVVSAPVASPVAWRWPAEGQLIGRYVSGEATKQGIDIVGNSGQAVRAAGDGVIVYSGSGLVGYGELIIVKHNDAWLSAYGHNRARLVNEGQLVKAGQQIAEMGRSGAARDMLHFEIRYNGKPVDPLRYLPDR
ncbi:MAG: peptidoglycan DD-metalloendopeptidase family protein [Luteimonas sp.]